MFIINLYVPSVIYIIYYNINNTKNKSNVFTLLLAENTSTIES